MILTITYGDSDEFVRNSIGNDIHHFISHQYPQATFYCDRFTGIGEWTTTHPNGSTLTEQEYSGVIVVDIPDYFTNAPSIVRGALTVLATTHGQEAIGLMVAPKSDLVTP